MTLFFMLPLHNMAKIVAWIISVLLNPVFLNLLGYLYFKYQFPVYVKAYDLMLPRLMMGITMFTFLLPLSFLAILYVTGKITSFSLEDRSQRTLPYILFLLCYLYNFYELYKLGIPGMLNTYAFITVLTLLYCLILNRYTKVSAHTAALGGLLGFVFMNAVFLKNDNRPIIIILFMLCGLVFWARTYLKAHHPNQLFWGLIGGSVIGFLTGWVGLILALQ